MLVLANYLRLLTSVAFVLTLLNGVCVFGDQYESPENGDDCTTPTGGRGICKNLKNCKRFLKLLVENKSNANSPTVQLLRKSHCGFEGLDPIVCCPFESEAPAPKSDAFGRLKGHVVTSRNVLNEESCGLVQNTNKIVGGTTATLSEFPWMALIGYSTSQGLQYRCGGSLVSSRYVLTAAHCVSTLTNISPVSVRLGEYDLSTRRDCTPSFGCSPTPVDVSIEKIIPHPGYTKLELQNDIALIKLAQKVKMTNFIRSVCLPMNKTTVGNAVRAVVTGWGTTELGIKSNILQKASLPLVSPVECARIYRRKIIINEASQVCAGGESGKDSCSGDSGGPLQIVGLNSAGRLAYIQRGIVSFGPRNCGTEGIPGVYTKVSHYIDWIYKNVDE